MKRVVCWNPRDAYSIINPDADAVDDFVFRAVHTDRPVPIVHNHEANATFKSNADFLADVLSPQDHVIVPVVGDSGTGKSHLIRWLYLRIRGRDEGREVVYVPKARTNLRDIVHLLVRLLTPNEQLPYLNELNAAGSGNLSKHAQRVAILNALNLALVNDIGGKDPSVDPESEAFWLTGLRAMFSDPYIRETLVLDGGFAAELAAHVFEKPDQYRPAEERREFRDRDLPLQVSDLKNAAHATRELLGQLIQMSEVERQSVVKIVNRHVDWAIATCLNLTGDRLISLMSDLRKHFKHRNKELVLLIEDFARLQGLDRALLQSIIEQKGDLCILRTVFASTVGFYESIESTIKTRITFVVDMDAQGAEEVPSLDKFVARYMNALRWGLGALKEQWEDFQEGRTDFAVPSKCEGCSYRQECHSGFGQIDRMGLYPFTSAAIAVMAERADESVHKSSPRPREFLKNAVKPTVLAGEQLADGSFPPATLLARLGGRKMPLARIKELQQRDPQQWDRRATILELWGHTHEARNLEPWLHAAFDLPLVQGFGNHPPPEPTPPAIPPKPQPGDHRIAELQAWYERGTTLNAATAQKLRDLIFEAMREYIDWDDLGLATAPFMGKNKGVFKPGQISFLKQATQASATAIRLQIPAKWDDDAARLRTTLALEGLLEASTNGNWSFPDGLQKLAMLLECLDDWGAQVIDQCQRHDLFADQRNAAIAAFETRAIVQALLNRSSDLQIDQEVIGVVLRPLPDEKPDFLTSDLTDLAEIGRNVDPGLMELVWTRVAAPKGGAAGEFIDAARCLPVTRKLRDRRFLPDPERIPGADKKDLAEPGRRFIIDFAKKLPIALRKEAEARAAVARRCQELFGDQVKKDLLLESIQRVVDAAGMLNVSGAQPLILLKRQLDSLEVDAAVAILRAADPATLDPTTLKTGVGQVGQLLEKLCNDLASLLKKTEAELHSRLKTVGIDPEEEAQLKNTITSDLEKISKTFDQYVNANAH